MKRSSFPKRTCVTAISSILMGLIANLPFALAPGMGINAIFTFTLVLTMGVSWQTALGAVFISGIIFILLSVFKVREAIVRAIPASLRFGVAAGIGVFLALLGLTSVGFIVGDPATTVAFGGMNVQTILFVVGLLATSILTIKKVRGALVYGIVGAVGRRGEHHHLRSVRHLERHHLHRKCCRCRRGRPNRIDRGIRRDPIHTVHVPEPALVV